MNCAPVEIRKDAVYIEGHAQILLCASLFYFRIPREDWEERMHQLRMTGYNCIDVYIPWNFHELQPGRWDFEEMHDVAAFLALAARNDLYVVARPGPYICSEWDGGALPGWLYEEGMPLRQNDPRYLERLGVWLKKILPVVAENEVGRGGSVVAVQLENEMDFFACAQPEGYTAWLRDTARACGVRVPLTVCVGQCDVQGAGGDTPGVHPTFNAYADDNYPHLETQLAHMRELAAGRETPLLITETNRVHAFLKRELAAGARLLSPYNQVGGSDIDMTNGISNWAADAHRPLALMASDYDFYSMITVDGRLRAEAAEARRMAGLINSLGEELAVAQPAPAPFAPVCDFTPAQALTPDGDEQPCFPALKLRGGWLAGATNLSDRPGVMRVEAGEDTLSVDFRPYETRLLPWQFSLEAWGSAATICWSEAELCGLEREGDALRLTFFGGEGARVKAVCGGETCLAQGTEWRCIGGNTWLRVLSREQALEACTGVPPLCAQIPSQIETTGVTGAVAHEFCVREWAQPLKEGVSSMEAAGQFRGDVFYETQLPDDAPVLASDAADFLWVHGPAGDAARFCDGSSALLPGGCGAWQLRVQAWGHSNFNDVRQPSLRMGAGKGVSALARVLHRQDITDLWFIYPQDKYRAQGSEANRATDRILATSINTWSYPATPMTADFVRKVRLPGDCDRFWLYVERGDCADVTVRVDGKEAGRLRLGDQWIDLSGCARPGSSAELCLTVTRRLSHESLGRVELVSGQSLKDVRMYGLPVEAWQKMYPQKQGEAVVLPLSLTAGQELMLTGILPDTRNQARTLLLDGSGIEATLIAGGHVCGRVQLASEGYPEVRGGSSRRIYLPAAWAERGLCLHLCALGGGGTLTGIRWETIKNSFVTEA